MPQQNSESDKVLVVPDKCPADQTNIVGKCIIDSPKNSVSDIVQWTAVIAAAKLRKHHWHNETY